MTAAFKIKGLEKRFSEFHLGPIDLVLEPGIVLGYIGPNGAGKSTTMHCMVGLLKGDAGKIEIFGKENDPEDPSWKFDIGYVGDKHVFYENWTGARNLQFIKEFYPNWNDALMLDLVKRFEVPLNKRAKDLSSGNRVKLSLISALAHQPKLLILDEPTAGLDPVVRTEFLDVLFEVVESGERAIFYSTHILSDISRIADELAFINEGQLKVKTAKEDLIDNYRKISFRHDGNNLNLMNIVNTKQQGNEYKVITSNYNETINILKDKGAENIQEARMSVDEIAVEILKELK